MALGKDYVTQECSMARALEVVGERWTLLVVRDALYGVRRYNDFLVHLGIPRAVLAARLQALTAAGILEKRRYQQSPPRDEYVVTDAGPRLVADAARAGRLGPRARSRHPPLRHFLHTACGTELGQYGECPACGTFVPVEDVEMLPGAGPGPKPGGPGQPRAAHPPAAAPAGGYGRRLRARRTSARRSCPDRRRSAEHRTHGSDVTTATGLGAVGTGTAESGTA